MYQPGKAADPARGQPNRENGSCFPSSFAPVEMVS